MSDAGGNTGKRHRRNREQRGVCVMRPPTQESVSLPASPDVRALHPVSPARAPIAMLATTRASVIAKRTAQDTDVMTASHPCREQDR